MGWSLRKLLGRAPFDIAVRQSYIATVEQARQPYFYEVWSVPDTAIGRFDMVALHCFLVLHRLRGEASAQKFSGAYCETLFDDMDRNLREMGVGDLSVGKKIRKMAEGFFGRAAAYERALGEGSEHLLDVLRRNLYADMDPDDIVLRQLADYVQRCVIILAAQDITTLIQGRVTFASFISEAD